MLDGWRLQDLAIMEGVGREREISRLNVAGATADENLNGATCQVNRAHRSAHGNTVFHRSCCVFGSSTSASLTSNPAAPTMVHNVRPPCGARRITAVPRSTCPVAPAAM